MRRWASTATVTATILTAGLGLAATAGVGSAQHRHAGAHEHGRGTLNIAIEGTRVSMELEAPGMDIVGFEHKAATEPQKAAIEKAEQQLMAAEALFQLPAAAGCILATSSATLEGEDHDHDHDHDAKDHDAKDHDAKDHDAKDHDDGDKGHEHHDDKAGHAEGEHSGFRAEYAFDCKAPAALTSIGFGYFKAFAGAQKLDVTVITPKGQSKFEVSRDKPRLDLGGVM